MTKKDYIVIARWLGELSADLTVRGFENSLTRIVADMKADNPNFKSEKFFVAVRSAEQAAIDNSDKLVQAARAARVSA